MPSLKDSFFAIFSLVVAYSYSLYFILQPALGMKVTGSLFKTYSISLLCIAVVSSISTILKFGLRREEYHVCFLVFCFILLYPLTSLHYEQFNNNTFWIYYYTFGVRAITAVLTAIVIARIDGIISRIAQLAPYFALLYTSVVLLCILRVSSANLGSNMLSYNLENGMSYQSLSYYSTFAFGITLFSIDRSLGKKVKAKLCLLMCMCTCQLFCIISSGGRGGFLLACLFLICYVFKWKLYRNVLLLLLIFILATCCTHIIINNPYIGHGFGRIENFFSDANAIQGDARWIRYELAYEAFCKSFLWGNGIGSVFYEVGFYSHNMFTDILCEGGVLFLLFILSIIVMTLKGIKRLSKINQDYGILYIIFLSSLTFTMFSGYYLAESGIWFAITFSYLRSSHHE